KEETMTKRIGFIGLGLMGKPMARNLMKSGFDLIVHNRSRAVVDQLVSEGADPADSPKEAAAAADVIITMLPEDSHVTEVVTAANGVSESIRPDAVLVDMSTISPTTTRRLAARVAARGAHMLDAPVSGGVEAASTASLTIMVGGKAEIFERVLPVFQKLGKNINHIGDHGAGQVTKAANQIIVGLTIQAVAEALIFAKKSGVDPAKVRRAIMGGYAQSRVLELHGQRMLDRNFQPGGKVRSHRKDIEIVLSVAREMGICLPGTAMISQLFNAVVAHDGSDWDHSAIVTVLESMSDVNVCPQ
ncbi:MAG: 2-hydroxy-3-oxopropionate reductase, partial [Desulfobacterales bacterium]